MPYGIFLIDMEKEEIKKKITSQEMLQRLDSHYEMEEQLKNDINVKVQQLNQIRDEIAFMQNIILFQMKKEFVTKKK